MLADVLLDEVFERQDSFDTMSCSAEQSRCCTTPKKGCRRRGVLMDIFPHHFPGTFTSQVRSMVALQCGELHRPLLCEVGNPTHLGPGFWEHHWITDTRLNASGVTRVRQSARAQRDGTNEGRSDDSDRITSYLILLELSGTYEVDEVENE
jgi:hypothetical protein